MRCRQGEGEEEEVREGLTQQFSKPKLRKGLWSPEEDEKLIAYIMNNRMLDCSWASVAKQAGLQRCGKSCRLRWINYLRPGLKRGAFSRHEERLIMNLQSIMGNSRWSQIAAHMPGRTDNEIKNYWNSAIKKKLKLKHNLSSSTTKCKTDAKSNIPDRSHRISHTNSAFPHAYDAPASLSSAQPYSNAMPEGYQTPKNTFNVLTNGENQLCVPGVLELKQEQVQDQNDEIKQLISYFEILNDTATHTNDSVSSHADFISPSQQAKVLTESCKTTIPPLEGPDSANYSLGSTGITIPAVTERDCLKKQYENDRWRTSHCCSNANDGFHVADPEAYTVHKAEEYKSLYEKTTHQASPPLSFCSQFAGPAIKWPPGQSNEFQSENDSRDDLNLRNDVNLGIPKYVDIYCRKNNYQLPHIDGGVGNQWNFSTIPHEETDANPIPTILAGGGSGLFQIECEAGAGQVTGWAHDGIYNLNTSAISDFDQIYFS